MLICESERDLCSITHLFENLLCVPGQRIYKAVFKNKPPERNELFMPGRMVSYCCIDVLINVMNLKTTGILLTKD